MQSHAGRRTDCPDPSGTVEWSRVRHYHTVRTAHLERALQLPPAVILFGNRRYDFDEALGERVGAYYATTWQAARLLAGHDVDVVEINEPSSIDSNRRMAVAVAWLRLRHLLLRRRRPLVATYAIGNSSPFQMPPGLNWKGRALRRFEFALAHYLWWECDRVVFGSDAARLAYEQAFGRPRRRQATVTIPALPARCGCGPLDGDREHRLLFVGDLSHRKGLPLVLAAWPQVRAAVPEAELIIIGKGEATDRVRALADDDRRVRFEHDPPRDLIHAALARAKVLTLPSQRTPQWQEQIGLPIVEGLAHGCEVVTTDEGGLASWLAGHGHAVLPASAGADDLAASLVRALNSERTPSEVLADVPDDDGRLTADLWMFEPARPA